MNIRILACGVLIGACASSVITSLLSEPATASNLQEPGAGGAGMPTPEEMQRQMEEWMATMIPGPQHEFLKEFVGEWNTTTKVFWGGPDAPANESEGTAVITSVLDGRYTQQTTTSTFEMPDANGNMTAMPYAGLGLTGYDNVRNLYTGIWLDNMGTQMMAMKGAASPDGKTITMYGEMDEPMLKVFGRMVKYVITIESRDRHVFSIYDLHVSDDYKVMEIVYERQ